MKRLFFCLVACNAALQSAEPEKLLDSLRAEIRAIHKSDEKGDKELGRSQAYRVDSLLTSLSAGDPLKDEVLTQTLQLIEQIRAAALSDKINEICSSLITELRDRITKRQKELREKFQITLRKALSTGLNATNAKELDAPIQELARLQKEISTVGYRSDTQMLFNVEAISSVEQILTMIQDAMLAASNPSGRRGRDSTDRLQSASSNYSRNLGEFMPRTEFLEKMQAVAARVMAGQQVKPLTQQEFEKRVSDTFSIVKALDEMGPALTKIDELIAQQREVNGYTSDSGLIYQLRSYKRTYEDLREGAATSMSFATSSSSSDTQKQEVLKPIKTLLVKFALIRVLGVTGDLEPKQDESVANYLHRMLDAAYRSSNWQLMAKVLDAAQNMSLNSIVSTSDSTAIRQFLAGVNQERAGQYSGAVNSYLSALKTGSQAIPVEKIGEKLQAIKAQHPLDYEAGVQITNTPPSPRSYYAQGFVLPPGPPGFPTPSSSPTTSTLSIPAATTDNPSGKSKIVGHRSSSGESTKELKSGPSATNGQIVETPLGELNDRQFRNWLSTVVISEVESPYGNNYTYENEVLKSIRPGLNSPRLHPTGTIERGKLVVPFTESSATITIDSSLTKAQVIYSTGGTYPATITPKKGEK